MNCSISRLAEFGFSPELIKAIKSSGIESLRGPQLRILSGGMLLSKDNLLIHLPTSAGKTLLGELCALHEIINGKKAIFAVPLKALAEEKYKLWRQRYKEYGLNVVCSTADHCVSDNRLLKGEFDLAVVIYEKLRYFMVKNPSLFNQVGVVVWDEIQMLSDLSRGPLLEIVIAHVSEAFPAVRQVGLSAVLDYPDELADYMNARLISTDQRPVQLRKGIVHNGRFRYICDGSMEEGEEEWEHLQEEFDNTGEMIIEMALHFWREREPTLIFTGSRSEAQALAMELSHRLDVLPAERCLEELERMEDNQVTRDFSDTLQCALAYHDADLTPRQRRLVERGFRRGEILLLCATSTLAMGVNLPASNVISLPFSWNGNAQNQPEKQLLDPREWNNRAGRAGRGEVGIGRAVIPALNNKESDLFMRHFFLSAPQSLPLHLCQSTIHDAIPLLINWNYNTTQQIEEALRSTPSGYARLRVGSEQPDWNSDVEEGLDKCLAAGLIKKEQDEPYTITRLGQVSVTRGLGAGDSRKIVDFWIRNTHAIDEGRNSFANKEGIFIFFCALLRPAQQLAFRVERNKNRRLGYTNAIRDWLGDSLSLVQEDLVLASRWDEAHEIAAKKALAIRDWMSGASGSELEETYLTPMGRFYDLADCLAWLVEAGLEIAQTMGHLASDTESEDGDSGINKNITCLANQIRYGLPEEAIGLVACRTPGMGRGEMLKLWNAGFSSPEELAEASNSHLVNLLGEETAKQLRRILPPPSMGEDESSTSMPLDSLEMEGRAAGRKLTVLLNGRRIPIPMRSFELLSLLAWCCMQDKPWRHRAQLGIPFEYTTQYISRLRRDIRPYQLCDQDSLIASDGTGHVRLNLPPESIQMNSDLLMRSWPNLRFPTLKGKTCIQLAD
jgi:ATP-dependent DNA helicase